MSLSDLASLGSFVSGVAVLISLVYLALQIRQAEKNQQANVRQQRAGRNVAINLGIATEPSLVAAMSKAVNGAEDLSQDQLLQFWFYSLAIFNSSEDAFYQHRDGLMSDREFATTMNSVRRMFARSGFKLIWKWQRANYGQEFAEFVDSLMTTPVSLVQIDPATWRRELAKEVAAEQMRPGEPVAALSET